MDAPTPRAALPDRLSPVRRGERLIVLLCGGDKGSQARDIARAKTLAQEV